jgi:AcrR family transcriptional regulator
MTDRTATPPTGTRRSELLEAAYRYALRHGLAELSLRPLASAIGSSPRVLLYLFGSKDGLVRALLARSRADLLQSLGELGERPAEPAADDLVTLAGQVWAWLSAAEHRALMTLWVEAYARSLVDPGGPWTGFARTTVEDWLAELARVQPAAERDTPAGLARRTAVLAVLRGALLDLLATGDGDRTTEAVHRQLAALAASHRGSEGV